MMDVVAMCLLVAIIGASCFALGDAHGRASEREFWAFERYDVRKMRELSEEVRALAERIGKGEVGQ